MSRLVSAERRRGFVGRLLCYGSPSLAAAVSLSFVALEITRTVPPTEWIIIPLWGNVALAAAGCGYGAVYASDRPGRRLATSVAAGVAGLVCYAGLFFVGLVSFVTAHNALGGNS